MIVVVWAAFCLGGKSSDGAIGVIYPFLPIISSYCRCVGNSQCCETLSRQKNKQKCETRIYGLFWYSIDKAVMSIKPAVQAIWVQKTEPNTSIEQSQRILVIKALDTKLLRNIQPIYVFSFPERKQIHHNISNNHCTLLKLHHPHPVHISFFHVLSSTALLVNVQFIKHIAQTSQRVSVHSPLSHLFMILVKSS